MDGYRLVLLEIFEERRATNPRYSLRAFSRACGVSPTSLCQVLKGQRKLTVKSARRIAEGLALSPDRARSLAPTRAARQEEGLSTSEVLDVERFKLVADWYHYAILSLSELPGHQPDPEWLADKLGITRTQATEARKRLLDMGLLEIRRGRLKQVHKGLATTHDVPSAALRRHHRQHLERAVTALETVPVEWREFGSMTLAVDSRKLPQVKRLVRKFRQQVAALCDAGEPDMVYHLCTQLFPTNHPDKFSCHKEPSREN